MNTWRVPNTTQNGKYAAVHIILFFIFSAGFFFCFPKKKSLSENFFPKKHIETTSTE